MCQNPAFTAAFFATHYSANQVQAFLKGQYRAIFPVSLKHSKLTLTSDHWTWLTWAATRNLFWMNCAVQISSSHSETLFSTERKMHRPEHSIFLIRHATYLRLDFKCCADSRFTVPSCSNDELLIHMNSYSTLMPCMRRNRITKNVRRGQWSNIDEISIIYLYG